MAILLDNEQNAIPTFGSYEQRDRNESIEDFVPQTYYEKYVENEKKKIISIYYVRRDGCHGIHGLRPDCFKQRRKR